ncbi:hypothetical protein KP004_08975 [Geomonas oryzisoli]|uniref:Lysozyme inhibitor LprI N-terminal domain-containing protein n=1 Tax=Geomonas oryzisoli TaxID=2847992 RepID=A0ABX8JBA6_9BACT|nr:hypothetical protein [Geomonas oryzisoli]QWV95286.1 hypothetical protein KP004_08975 [Geomonas oryzisoli]
MTIITHLFVFLLLITPWEALAAGFDCTKAGTKLEKLICKDLELSAADDRVSLLFKEALKKSTDRDMLLQTQREWLKRRNAFIDREALLKIYNDRVIELQEPVWVPVRSVTSTCPQFLKRNDIDDISKCQVSESGRIGTEGNKTYLYTLYCIVPAESGETGNCTPDSYYGKRGLSVYVQDGPSQPLKLFLDRGSSDIGLREYEKPELLRNQFGKILYVPIRLDGTGNFNESDYYIWDEGAKRWSYLDSNRWLDDLEKYLPRGTHVLSGVWPDLKSMTAEVLLYRKNDPNCCPSGGTAFVTLSIEKGRFNIRSVKVTKDVK